MDMTATLTDAKNFIADSGIKGGLGNDDGQNYQVDNWA